MRIAATSAVVLLLAAGCGGGHGKATPTTYTVPMATRVSDWDSANIDILTRLTDSDALPAPPFVNTCRALPPIVTSALAARIPDPPLEAKWKAALTKLQNALDACSTPQGSGSSTTVLSAQATAAIDAEYKAGWKDLGAVLREMAALVQPDFTNGPPPTSPTGQ